MANISDTSKLERKTLVYVGTNDLIIRCPHCGKNLRNGGLRVDFAGAEVFQGEYWECAPVDYEDEDNKFSCEECGEPIANDFAIKALKEWGVI